MKKILWLFIFFILAAIGWLLLFRKDHILSKAEANRIGSHASSRFISWKGNKVHFTVEGHGETILLVHPFGGSHNNFRELAGILDDSFRVVCVDLPGSGLSDFKQSGQKGIRYFTEYENFLNTIADTLGLDKFCLVGNSFGGAVAYTFAAHHPDRVRSLVLLCSVGYDSKTVLKKGAGMLKYPILKPLVNKGIPKHIVREMHIHHLADKSKANKTDIDYHSIVVNREGNIPAWFDFVASRQYPDSTIITRIQCPTLIIWGNEDMLTPVEHAQRFKRDIEDSRVRIYSPAGHMPQMEFPGSIAADIIAFVREK